MFNSLIHGSRILNSLIHISRVHVYFSIYFTCLKPRSLRDIRFLRFSQLSFSLFFFSRLLHLFDFLRFLFFLFPIWFSTPLTSSFFFLRFSFRFLFDFFSTSSFHDFSVLRFLSLRPILLSHSPLFFPFQFHSSLPSPILSFFVSFFFLSSSLVEYRFGRYFLLSFFLSLFPWPTINRSVNERSVSDR